MRQRDLARARAQPAADQCRQRGRMVRVAKRPLARQPAAAQPARDRLDHARVPAPRPVRAAAGSRAGAPPASTCRHPAGRPSTNCDRRRRRSRGRAWRSPGPSRRSRSSPAERDGASRGSGGGNSCVPLKWLTIARRLGAAMTSTSPAQAASPPQAAGQMKPLAAAGGGQCRRAARRRRSSASRRATTRRAPYSRRARPPAMPPSPPAEPSAIGRSKWLPSFEHIGRGEVDGDALAAAAPRPERAERRRAPARAIRRPPCRAARRR